MKRITLALMLACAAGPGTLAAQTTQSATANVNISVNQALSVRVHGNTHFGNIFNTTSQTATVNPTAPAAGTFTANFEVVGVPNSDVTISYPPSTSLLCGINTLTFTPNLTSDNTGLQVTSVPAPSGSTQRLNSGGSNGYTYLWLGGSIPVPADQPACNYWGQFTLTVNF